MAFYASSYLPSTPSFRCDVRDFPSLFRRVVIFTILQVPFVIITVLFIQIITLPIGKFLEWVLPRYRISVFGRSFSLNPGPFNIKEHALIAVMVNVDLDVIAITDVATAMRIVYGVRWSVGKQFFLGLVFRVVGFSFAGLFRHFLVWPSSMIWPGVLVRCALLNAMHSNYGKKDSKHVSRERFLYLTMLGSFLYFWLPGYLWTGLSVFNWACWIAPKNVIVNSLFGTVSGFGLGLLTFDWAQITTLGNPLVIPVCFFIRPRTTQHTTETECISGGRSSTCWAGSWSLSGSSVRFCGVCLFPPSRL